MRFAAHGYIADDAGSSAGANAKLLAKLLESGHEVHFYGVPFFTEPKRLEQYPGYRYFPMYVPWIARGSQLARKIGGRYPRAIHSVLSQPGYQREALRLMERASPGYDCVLCLDTLNLWRSSLPVVSWPQSPPHTEWAALRQPHLARTMIESEGLPYYAAVQLFYAYRWLHARRSIRASDLILSSSRWAYDLWRSFGQPEQRIQLIPYPVDLAPFEHVPLPPPEQPPTFLWLGRAVPRKRFDLLLRAFEIVQARRPNVVAHVVANLAPHRAASELLASYRGNPGIIHTPGVPRSAVPELLGRVHVLVQPSESENFGFAVAEALAAGRPVVVGPTNGTGMYAGDASYSFASYDPESVAAAMERAISATLADPARVASIARLQARRHFELTTVAKAVETAARRAMELKATYG